jgi:transcriptional regulator with XRE-family HTH domain
MGQRADTIAAMTLAKKLKLLMSDRELKGPAVAQRIGVKQQQVSRWTRGEQVPDAYEALRLARLFRVDVDWFIDPEREDFPYLTAGPGPAVRDVTPAYRVRPGPDRDKDWKGA